MEKKGQLFIRYLKMKGIYHDFVKVYNKISDKKKINDNLNKPNFNTWYLLNLIPYSLIHKAIKVHEKNTSLYAEIGKFENYYQATKEFEKIKWISDLSLKFYYSPALKGIIYLDEIKEEIIYGNLSFNVIYWFISDNGNQYKRKIHLTNSTSIRKIKLRDVFANAILLDTKEKVITEMAKMHEKAIQEIDKGFNFISQQINTSFCEAITE